MVQGVHWCHAMTTIETKDLSDVVGGAAFGIRLPPGKQPFLGLEPRDPKIREMLAVKKPEPSCK